MWVLGAGEHDSHRLSPGKKSGQEGRTLPEPPLVSPPAQRLEKLWLRFRGRSTRPLYSPPAAPELSLCSPLRPQGPGQGWLLQQSPGARLARPPQPAPAHTLGSLPPAREAQHTRAVKAPWSTGNKTGVPHPELPEPRRPREDTGQQGSLWLALAGRAQPSQGGQEAGHGPSCSARPPSVSHQPWRPQHGPPRR